MIIFRYLTIQVLQIVCVVTGILLSVALTGRFIQYLGEAVAGDKAPEVLLLIMLYRIPEFLLVILPLALFLAIILAYGRMYADNEMVILMASGVSQRRLLFHTAGVTLLILCVMAGISLYLSPSGQQKMEVLIQQQSQLTEIDLIVAGQFQTFAAGRRTTYAERIGDAPGPGRELHNVFVALSDGGEQADGIRPPRILLADSARPEIDSETGARFMRLDSVRQYDGTPGDAEFTIGQFDRHAILLPAPRSSEKVLEESTISTAMLIGSNRLSHQAELQWRISMLILIPVISLIAVPMSKVNPRQGRYSKLFPAALVYMVYFVSLEFCRDLVAEGKLHPAVGLWWIHFLFAGAGLAVMQPGLLRWFSQRERA